MKNHGIECVGRLDAPVILYNPSSQTWRNYIQDELGDHQLEFEDEEPQWFETNKNCGTLYANPHCLYRSHIYRMPLSVAASHTPEENDLLVKHFTLSRDEKFKRIRREVEAFRNLERISPAEREPILEQVRLFVWQRDLGQCVKCESRKALEFDHIIPVAEGGSSTERNVQLLCERCNRRKGKNI